LGGGQAVAVPVLPLEENRAAAAAIAGVKKRGNQFQIISFRR